MGSIGNKKLKILLVDDDDIQHQIAESMLKKDYEVYKVRSGNEALDYLRDDNNIPDLILLDILMPEMDGWEVFNRVKAISLLKNVPIAFLTSITESTEEKRAYEIGADDFITKPYKKEELLNRVKKILEKQK